jgi:phytol kinase
MTALLSITSAVASSALILSLLVTLLWLLSRFTKPSETSRKITHMLMGLACLSLPWLFSSSTPVIVLSIVVSILLSGLKLSEQSKLYPVLFSVGRRSIGEVCFPLGVSLTFILSNGVLAHYIAPVAILALADSLSALIGMKFGSKFYKVVNGSKTLEGSLAFFVTAAMAAFVSLSLLTTASLPHVLMLALIAAIAATAFEGMSWGGLDNLFVPVGTLLVLAQVDGQSELQLSHTLAVFIGVFLLILALKRLSTLQGGAALAVVGYMYVCYMLGGLAWILLPVVLYASYRRLMPKRFAKIVSTHSIFGVLSVASVGIFWLLASHKSDVYIYPYATALATHGAIIASAHIHLNAFDDCASSDKLKIYSVVCSVLKSWSLIFIPLVFMTGLSTDHIVQIFLAPIWIFVATALFVTTTKVGPDFRNSASRWIKQGACAAIGSALALVGTL